HLRVTGRQLCAPVVRPWAAARVDLPVSGRETYDRGVLVDTQYEDLLRTVLHQGSPKPDRTGTGTRSVFGHQLRYDLTLGFPLITTKRVHLRSVVYELLWFLRGE